MTDEIVSNGNENSIKSIDVSVNHSKVTLSGKKEYILVDVLDIYYFDLSAVRGNRVVIRKNNEEAEFTTPINNGDSIELFWET